MYHVSEDGYCTCGRAVSEVHVDDGTTFGRWAIVDSSGSEQCEE